MLLRSDIIKVIIILIILDKNRLMFCNQLVKPTTYKGLLENYFLIYVHFNSQN